MDKKQNIKSDPAVKFCRKCGAPKFKRWDQLSVDERKITERFLEQSGFRQLEAVFCARCLNPFVSPESSA